FNAAWLPSVTATLREFDGWGLGLSNIPDSYVLIFGRRLLVNGHLSMCKSASEGVEPAARLLKSGGKRWWQFWRRAKARRTSRYTWPLQRSAIALNRSKAVPRAPGRDPVLGGSSGNNRLEGGHG